jgi:hypothetical protein
MDIGSEMLARYMEFLASAKKWSDDGFSKRMQACMILDKVAGDMMDGAANPKERDAIYVIYNQIKRRTLDSSSEAPVSL